MYPILLKLFFVIGMATAILAISLVLFSSIFFDRRNDGSKIIQELPIESMDKTKIKGFK